MTSSQRIIVNTAAQYTRTIINVCLSLYSTRLILSALGQSDYGIFALVAGVISMLSFLTNALAGIPQRFLSYYHGAKKQDMLKVTFANCIILHTIIGLGFLLVLSALSYPIIYHLLDIDASRIHASMAVYFSASVMLLLTFITAPIRALFIARENIVYTSVVEVLDGVLKLGIAILLTLVLCDKLILYSGLLILISVFNLVAYLLYAAKKYEECHLPHKNELDIKFIKQIFHFAAWNIYASGCIMVRSQGFAILFNRFIGLIANAAYGIAHQVMGATNFLAYSILNAMAPQITKAEGAHNRDKAFLLSAYASKYAVLLQSLILIPIIFEMPAILKIWLNDIPVYCVLFCRIMLISSIIDQATIGLTSANQAIGNLKIWNLTVNTSKLFALPVAFCCLYFDLPIISALLSFLFFEMISSILRIPIMSKSGLSIPNFIKVATLPIILPLAVNVITAFACTSYINVGDNSFRFLITGVLSVATTVITTYLFSLDKNEKNLVHSMLFKFIHKIW